MCKPSEILATIVTKVGERAKNESDQVSLPFPRFVHTTQIPGHNFPTHIPRSILIYHNCTRLADSESSSGDSESGSGDSESSSGDSHQAILRRVSKSPETHVTKFWQIWLKILRHNDASE